MENVKQSFSTITGKLETSISICRIQARFSKRKTSKNPALKKKTEGKYQNVKNVKSDVVRMVRNHG